MTYNLGYTPTEKQALFHRSGADEVLYGGAAGGGKSRAIVMEAVIDALEHDGVESYLFRRSYPELETTLIAEAIRCVPKELYKYSKITHDMTFKNGSVLHFRFCRSLSDAYKYQGCEMHRIYIDELTHFTLDIYDYLKTRLRAPKRLNIKPKIRLTTNPGGVGHGWVKAMFIDSAPPFEIHKTQIRSQILGETRYITRQYIPAYATDNPHLTSDYIVELEQKPPALRRALLLGDWNVFEGQVFTEFVNDPSHYNDRLFTHVINPFVIPKDFKRYRSLDWGYTRPFSVGYWAQDGDGRLYRYAEIYGSEKDAQTGLTIKPNVGMRLSPHEVAALIRKYEDKYEKGNHIIGIADPSIFDESRGSDGCIASIMERQGIFFSGGDNERIAGKMQIHHRLSFDERGVPMMYIFSNCKDFIRTFPTLVYDVNRAEDINTDGEDHIYDETRYMCMYKAFSFEQGINVLAVNADGRVLNGSEFKVFGGKILLKYPAKELELCIISKPEPFDKTDYRTRGILLDDGFSEIYIYYILSRAALIEDDIERLNNYSQILSGLIDELKSSRIFSHENGTSYKNIW